MNNLKSYFGLKNLIVLFVIVASAVAFSSCKDDKDEPGGANSLVGTWYFSGDGGLDYDDTFTFSSNGTVSYRYDDEYVTGKYSYDAESSYLTLMWNDPEWGTERLHVRFISDNVAEFGGDYGVYTRK